MQNCPEGSNKVIKPRNPLRAANVMNVQCVIAECKTKSSISNFYKLLSELQIHTHIYIAVLVSCSEVASARTIGTLGNISY
jgi:hypothetical protein